MKIELINAYRPGCIGRITELHGSYYHRHTGFGLYFEAKVAMELAEFLQRYDARRDGIWLLLADGVIEGSIVIDGAHADTDGAHLRWFIVSDRLRGTGQGKVLLQAAVNFCVERRYARTFLWTFEGLQAARRLYEEASFRLCHEQRGDRWGAQVNEQQFELLASTV